MNKLRHTDAGFEHKLDRLCAASSLFDSKIEAAARAIVESVAAKGDVALLEFAKKIMAMKPGMRQSMSPPTMHTMCSTKVRKAQRAGAASAGSSATCHPY